MTTRPPHPSSERDGPAARGTDRGSDRASAQAAAQAAAASVRRVRAGARRLLVARALGLLAGSAVLAVAGAGLADFALRMPAALRWTILLAGVAALVAGARRVLIPALRFKPSLSSIALRIERASARERSTDNPDSGASRLASAVELGRQDPPADDPERSLHDQALRSAVTRTRPGSTRGALRSGELGRAALFAGVALVFGAVLAIQWPGLFATGLERVLMPWTDEKWPRRYPIADLNPRDVHPIDQSFPVRAALGRDDASGAERRVVAHYRIVRGEGLASESTPERRVVLTDQNRSEPLPEDAGIEGRTVGALFERLIEPGVFEGREGDDRPVFLSYRVSTPDDTTPTKRVRLVEPPAIASASATVTPPAYARDAQTAFVSGPVDLGTGTDERAAVSPVLAGSRVAMRIEFNKPLPLGDRPAWADVFARGPGARVTVEGPVVTIQTELDEPARMPVDVADEHGFLPRDAIVMSFDVVPDEAPEAAITAPAHDEPVLASALIDAVADGRDDLGVASVALEAQRARPPADSAGAPPEPMEKPVVVAQTTGGQMRLSAAAALDLSALELQPGDEVRLWSVVTDTLAASGADREPTRSRVRTLRVIGEPELVEQLQAELTGLRRTVERLDEDQARLEDDLRSGQPDPSLRDRQRALGDRVGLQRRVIERLEERRERNRLEDTALETTLRDASALLQAAEDAAGDAADRVPESDEPTRDELQQAEEAQARVRDELGRLAQLLDQGRDGWLARRSVERLLDDQRRLREDTASAGAETVGRSLEQLEGRELTALERIAQRQRDAADRAGDAVDELGERADELSEADPAQSAAMSSAEARARDRRLSDLLEQASDQIAQNQPGRAVASQDEAIEILEDLLEELDNADRARDSALRRQLASAVDSIKNLVALQESEIERLEAGAADLDQGMIRLNRNTLAVRAELAQDAGLASVAGLLRQASDAQGSAITALRAQTPDLAQAEREERASLLLLNRALAEAERMLEQAEQRERDRVREELRQAYAEAAERQTLIAGETRPLIGERLSRRQRTAARDLGRRQGSLRDDVADVLARTDALAEAHVFRMAHRRLDQLMTGAGDALDAGAPTPRTGREQDGSATLLASLAQALADPPQPDQPFEQGAAGGGGGQGQGGGEQQQGPAIPPVHELMLLRSMQEQAFAITRFVDESDAPEPGELQDAAELQQSLAQQTLDLIQRMQEDSPDQIRPGEINPVDPNPEQPELDEPMSEPAGSVRSTPEEDTP